MADIVYCELMKLKRSKIILIGILGSLIVPFLVVTNDIRICFSNPSIVLSLGGIYEDIIMFIMLLFGSLVMSGSISGQQGIYGKNIENNFCSSNRTHTIFSRQVYYLVYSGSIVYGSFMAGYCGDSGIMQFVYGCLAAFIAIAAVSLLNVVLSGSPIAGFYPWTASYLLLTGRLEQSGCPTSVGILIIFLLCLFGICYSIFRFQKNDIV